MVGVLHRLFEFFRIVERDLLQCVSGARAEHQMVDVLRSVDGEIGTDASRGWLDGEVRGRIARRMAPDAAGVTSQRWLSPLATSVMVSPGSS